MKLAMQVSGSVMKTGVVLFVYFAALATAQSPNASQSDPSEVVDGVSEPAAVGVGNATGAPNAVASAAVAEAAPAVTASTNASAAASDVAPAVATSPAAPAATASANASAVASDVAPAVATSPAVTSTSPPLQASVSGPPVASTTPVAAVVETGPAATPTIVPVVKAADGPLVAPLVLPEAAKPEVTKPVAAESVLPEATAAKAEGSDEAAQFERFKPPSAGEIYSSERKTPEKATSLDGDETDIDASVRERIEQDSKRVGKIAENLVGVQGDINRVEKEVLGKVFDMSTMKSFLNAHEEAIKDHEKLDKEDEDLNNQATSLSKQLDKSISETSAQDKKHRAAMTQLSAAVSEDKAVIQGLQKELIPLVEMQKEVEKLPPVNANLTAENTMAVASAQAATEELVYEKSKLKTYQETTGNLMKELVKQHDYATKCHERLHQLNTQLHEVNTKDARTKYEQSRTNAKGEAMEKLLEEKNAGLEKRLKKAKTNLQTITFAKANAKAKIGALQSEGQLHLEKLKAELGELRQQSASIETAMMAKITNRKLIEKALRGASVQVEDMQARLLAGKLDKLRRNNTQMTGDLDQIRTGLQKAQIATAKAESQQTQLLQQAAQMKEQAKNMTAETQDVARQALAKVIDARNSDDEASQQAQAATMEAQASMLVKCSAIWEKDHRHVAKKLKQCRTTKLDLDAMKASVATLTSSVKR